MTAALAGKLAAWTPLRLLKLFIVLVCLIGLPAVIGNPVITTVFISALMFGTFGAIYDLMIGYGGLTNFGYAAFIAVGAYASGVADVNYGISPWLGLAIGGAMGAISGFLTGALTLRLRGLYLGLMTWFIGESIRSMISNATSVTRGMLGLSVDPFPNILGIDFSRGHLLSYYFLLVVLSAIIFGAMFWLVQSKIGLAFKAIREDQLASESLGVNATKYKLLNFTVASFFTGVMGSFYAHYLGILSPTPEEFGVQRTVEVLTMAYVGGRGTLWGSVVAAFLLIGVQEYFRSLGAWRLVLFGVLLILVMLFAQKGLAGVIKRLW